MNYDALSKNTVKITLTRQDMKNYSLRSDIIGKRNAETKRTLAKFLKRFQSESLYFSGISTERLFLEAFPAEDGGCIMYVSALGTEKTEAKSAVQSASAGLMMCTAQSLEDIKGLCGCMKAAMPECVFALYRLGSEYSMIAAPKSGTERPMARIMEEYGELSRDPVDIACTAEHGTPV